MIKENNFPTWPYYEQDEIDAVTNVLASGKVNYWTGQEVKLFEQEFADYCDCQHAIGMANGTITLEVALRSLNVGKGDDVLVSSRTYIASASAIVQAGARPVFADVDMNSQNVTVDTLQAVITDNTKALIVVHLAGWPCDMDSLMQFAQENKLYVIEDCAQAHGARYKGKAVGGFGDFGSFSFCQDKIMSTGGEGGMLITNNKSLWQKAWSFKDHGKDYQMMQTPAKQPGFKWVHKSIGSNYRMTEMQAAIGRKQLTKLNEWLERRSENASVFHKYFSDIPYLKVVEVPGHIKHAYYKYYVFIKPDAIKEEWTRDKILSALQDKGVPVSAGSCSEVYLEEAFKPYACVPEKRHQNAKRLGEISLMFQVHPTLHSDNVVNMAESTVETLNLVMK